MAEPDENPVIPEEVPPVTPETPPEAPPETPPETPPAETPPEETPPETPPEETPPEDRPPSRRETLRIQDLLGRGDKPARKKAGEEQPLDYSTALDPETPPEVLKQFEDDRTRYGESRERNALETVKSIQFHTRLEIDAPRIESKYPQLNKDDKENFDPVVANALNTHYLNLVGWDPETDTVQNSGLRYADFVDAQMELAKRLSSRASVETKRNITSQAANTGIRPDGSAPRMDLTKAPQDMTDAELQAVIAGNLPK